MRFFPSLLLLSLCLLLPIFSISKHPPAPIDYFSRVLDEVKSSSELFKQALQNLLSQKSTKIRQLFSLKPKDGRVNLVTYTSYDYPKQNLPTEYHLLRDIWVSSEEEIKSICNKWKIRGEKLKMRLLQLLGLKPDHKMSHFVTFSVPIDQVYRPSANPDPTSLFPCGHNEASDCLELLAGGNLTEHQKIMASWLNATMKMGPRSAGYPWTGLGYTYDWNPTSQDNYGVSEYIIKSHSNVTILSLVSDEEYCNQSFS